VYSGAFSTIRVLWWLARHCGVKVLLLSAYAARSHVYWQDSLQAMFPEWEWQVLTLPPRHFSWRVRGNPLYWALRETELLNAEYDLLLATSMVDLATLRGLVPALARLPSVLYFHENQFAYPASEQQSSLLEAQMVSLYSALAADRLFFNSRYNRDSFLSGCEQLLKRLPDKVPAGIPELLGEKAVVVSVAVTSPEYSDVSGIAWTPAPPVYPDRPLRLLWQGRFEHDKGGDGLLLALRQLEQGSLDYELAVIGQQFRDAPGAFAGIEQQFSHRLVQFGFVPERGDYHQYLLNADIVLSTALHEFQGLAVLEAVAAGCIPVVPKRLAYPEIFSSRFCYATGSAEEEASAVAERVTALADALASGLCPPDVSGFSQDSMRERYRREFFALASGQGQ
jgi:glycosyltransferase involved in cell wall biosynthesis